MNLSSSRRDESDDSAPRADHPSTPHDVAESTAGSGSIGSRAPDADHPLSDALGRLEVGADVYSSDGVYVAVVEMLSADHVTVRAGSPGRPVDLPLRALARVSPQGDRLELHMSSEEMDRLAGGDQPGYAHLAAQRPEAMAPEEREDEARSAAEFREAQREAADGDIRP
jgi:hypothetical protein